MNRKYRIRYLFPILAMMAGILITSFWKIDNEFQTTVRYAGLQLSIYSGLYLIVISLLQFIIRNNNFLIPTCLFVVVTLLYFQYKIQHYPGQTEILVIGNSIVLIGFGIGFGIGFILNRRIPASKT